MVGGALYTLSPAGWAWELVSSCLWWYVDGCQRWKRGGDAEGK